MDIQKSPSYILAKISRKIEISFQNVLNEYPLTLSHYGILLTIYNNENISQTGLGKILEVDRATMVYLLDFLEEENYLKRVKNPNDRRSFQLVLTSKGKSILKPLWKIRTKIEQKTFENLNKKEKKIINRICRQIN
jgi:DNA-binding MarR family transcriptional regulator